MYNVKMLRVIACLSVLVVHLGQLLSLTGSIRVVTDFGRCGVQLFFIISGYLAWISYSKYNNILHYYSKRAIRILPLYYLVILTYFIEDTFIFRNVPEDSLGLYWSKFIFFINGFVGSEQEYWNNIGFTWTIPAFVLFYLLVPLFKKILTNYNRVLVACFLALILNRATTILRTTHLRAPSQLVFFFAGILIYYAVQENKQNQTITLLLLGTLFFAIQSAEMDMIVLTVFPLLLMSTQNIDLSRFHLLSGCIDSIDRYSYAIYLIQGVIYHTLTPDYPKYIILLCMLPGTFVLAFLLHKFYEVPLQNRLLSLLPNSNC